MGWLDAFFEAPVQRLTRRFVPVPLPPAGTFDGQTVLIAGATSGLGLAAAVHFATLGANVIITYRVASRGDAAKRHIEQAAGPSRKGDITCLELDLERYDSCTSFMAKLKSALTGPAALDVAIISGGIVNSHFEESAQGWEKTIQINTISTTLMGLLLLGWMRGARDQRESPAHIVFLSSREHLDPDFDELVGWSQREEGILRQVCSKDNWPGLLEVEPNYAISKLLLMYTLEEISRLARGPDGDPLVLVNSVCPGMVKTDIGRHVAKRSWLHALLTFIVLLITAKSADSGARICVTAALKPKENHHCASNRKAATIISSEKARTLQRLVWKEVSDELKAKVPELQTAGLDGL
ncbi:Retinol dehydrogenase 14 [Madurella mycetomatis]|uniref:Retinol dehydrogenase 14 n=1 Tax=Madurella mycetomatis TaxID=100816 RepID=A0A175VWJ0_9PEZI|nr:Retinol dehydrogenase 14 [Madurella mycetomatis]KXX81250.1 Retinol dehydrogenase 14 [Madurella mycetomatis]